jgi:hypothetical protein
LLSASPSIQSKKCRFDCCAAAVCPTRGSLDFAAKSACNGPAYFPRSSGGHVGDQPEAGGAMLNGELLGPSGYRDPGYGGAEATELAA